jgi:anti-sigma factor RsiW
MTCETIRELLDGYADGEIDLVNHLQIEKHLAECADCARAYNNIASLKSAAAADDLYYRAPSDLRARISSSLGEREPKPASEAVPSRTPWWVWRWTPVFASLLIVAAAAAVYLGVLRPSRSNDDLLAKEFVSAHVRSMMTDHLMDVVSTDQHTVKPWFDGKIDFAPPVTDLAAEGYPLTGGRLDYVGDHTVAALVYARRQHRINLFISPTADADSPDKISVVQGYNVVHWTRSGMTFWAVSDLNFNELQEFALALQK